MSDSESMEQWSYDEYKLLNVTPCTDIMVVFAVEDDESPGKHKLVSEPIHFVGVAEVTTHWMERPKGAKSRTRGREVGQPEERNEVVGLELVDGSFDICNDQDNFTGLCRRGDDVSNAVGHHKHWRYPLTQETKHETP